LTKSPRSARKRAPWLVALGCLFVVFLAGEFVLEWVGFGSPALVVQNSFTSYELRPEQNVVRRWPLSEDRVSRVTTNRVGMRADEIPPNHSPGVLRIFFVGDSLTYGTTQVDQKHIFTELVHRELPGILHRPVEVMNASAGGWAIENELGFVKEHGVQQADHVILCINSADPSQPKAELAQSGALSTQPYSWPKGYRELLGRVISPMAFKLLRRVGIHWSAVHDVAMDPGVALANDSRALAHNLDLLSEFQDYVSSAHAKFSILYIPFTWEVADPKVSEEGREAVRNWAAVHKVPFLYVTTMYGAAKLDDFTLRDRTHFNIQGNRMVANAIEQQWNVLAGSQH
jgi:hypothetical protein